MDFLDLSKKRCSVRKFRNEPVEKEKLMKILEAGRVAPTAANTQSQKILVIESKEGFAKLKMSANSYGAPLCLIVCADHSESWIRPFDRKDTADIDASIVTTHMMLQAEELGLASIWICYFKPDVLCAEFSLPAGFEPINILGIGYAEDGTRKSPDRHTQERKPLNQTVFYESF
ncbi:MAG: nitroreductase family protein [Eubacteriales bacterium]